MAYGDFVYINNYKMVDITPSMTSNTKPAPYEVKCSTNSGNYGSNTYKIFDGRLDTTVRSGIDVNAANLWVQMDFNKPVVVSAYSIAINSSYTLKSWKLLASNDESNWVELDLQENHTSWKGTAFKDFYIDNDALYRYYRIKCIAKNGTNSISFTEIRFLKHAPQKMQFYKTKEEFMPNTIENINIPEIHFTDVGNIYCSKQDGSFIKMNGADAAQFEEQNRLLKEEIEYLKSLLDTINGVEVTENG